jgi:hypothetical protein
MHAERREGQSTNKPPAILGAVIVSAQDNPAQPPTTIAGETDEAHIAELREQLEQLKADIARVQQESDEIRQAKGEPTRQAARRRRTVLRQLAAIAKSAREYAVWEILWGADQRDGNPLTVAEYALLWDSHLTALVAVRRQIAELLQEDTPTVPLLDSTITAAAEPAPTSRIPGERTVLSTLATVARSASKNALDQILGGLDEYDGVQLTVEAYARHWDQHFVTLTAIRGKIASLQSKDAATVEGMRNIAELAQGLRDS